MIDLVVFQVVSWVATAIGVCSAATYYILTLRNAKKSQSVQLINDVQRKFYEDRDFLSRRLSILGWQWKDYDDFHKKYGRETNFDANVTLWQVQSWYDSLGWAFRNKLVDINDLDEPFVYNILLFWRKLSPIILESRKRSTSLLWQYVWQDFEWLAKECERIEQEIILAHPAKPSSS